LIQHHLTFKFDFKTAFTKILTRKSNAFNEYFNYLFKTFVLLKK